MVEAIFLKGKNYVTVHGLTQWDYGQDLIIRGLELPKEFQVHFACKRLEEATVKNGTYSNGVGTVRVPDKILEQDTDLTAWVYVADANHGETIKTIYLPIVSRTKPSDFVYPNEEDYEEILDLAERFEHIGELIDEAEGNLGRIDKVVTDGQEAVADIKKQASLIGDGNVGEAIGSSITADSTFQGSAIIKEIPGATVQNQEPPPSLDYPQEIKAIGWFDGEMKNGYYGLGSVGKPIVFTSNDSYRCCKDAIPCKANDVIDFKIGEENQYMYIIAIDENSNGLKSFTKENNSIDSKHIKATMPSGSKAFVVYYGGANFKECDITVIVNDKYAVKVKTTGKNLLDFFKVHNPNNNSISKKIGENEYEIYALGDLYRNHYILSDEDTDITISGIIKNKSSKDNWTVDILNSSDAIVARIREGTEKQTGKGCKLRVNFITSQDGSIFKNIMVCKGNVNTEFEPYKETISYIPLDYPLYEGDKIYLEDGELWEYRENARVVFDGSDDEEFGYNATNNSVYTMLAVKPQNPPNKNVICNKFQSNENEYISYSTKNAIMCSSKGDSIQIARIDLSSDEELASVTSKSEFVTWLKQNPIEVVYKLATPTRKKLGSAEAFNLRTFDERTYIEVMGSKELGTENIFLVPKNQSGGIMTDAFATAKRNEINMAEQANIVSRIQALEKLAVKE